MEHLQNYELLENINSNFKKGDQVIGTKYGAGFYDLIIYNESMNKRGWVNLNQVKLIIK